MKLTERLRHIDQHPLVLGAARAVRRRLPGDDRYGDPLSLTGDQAPGLLGQRLALLAAERPSAMKEVGFSALQVWQSLSEAQGRGRGDEEVTIVFTDLSGFSDWVLDAGDTQALELLRRVANSVEPPIAARGGRVVKRLGDGVMAVFDDPEAAVTAALAACQNVSEIAGDVPRLRAGVHVGRPRRLGGDYFGVDVNVAARIASSAGPQEVLISDAVRSRLGEEGSVKVRRRWRFNAKGTPAGTRVFAVDVP